MLERADSDSRALEAERHRSVSSSTQRKPELITARSDACAHAQAVARCMVNRMRGSSTLHASVVARFIIAVAERLQVIDGVIIVAWLYIDRLLAARKDVFLTAINYQTLLVTGMLLASKMFDDIPIKNSSIGVLLECTVREVNTWERAFVQGLDFRLAISTAEYNTCVYDLNFGPVDQCAEAKTAPSKRLQALVDIAAN